MSDSNFIDKNNSERKYTNEVNIIQLFDYFGKVLNTILGVFRKAYFKVANTILTLLAFILSLFIKYIFIFSLLFIATFITLKILANRSEVVYKSDIIVKQNYDTGAILYSTIERLDLLTKLQDSSSLFNLSKELVIPLKEASEIKGFEIKDNMVHQDYLDLYNNYLKDKDSTSYMSLDAFKDLYDSRKFKRQVITVYSLSPSVYKANLSNQLMASITNSEFYKNEKSNQVNLIENKINVLKDLLNRSDTLKNRYINLLESYYLQKKNLNQGKVTKDLNLNLYNDNNQKITTREYDLFNNEKELRMQIVAFQDSLNNRSHILRLQKGFSPPLINPNFYLKNFWSIIFKVLFSTFFILLFKEINIIGSLKEYSNLKFVKKKISS